MKKIILLSFVVLITTLSYGQRKVDMATNMTSPTASTIIRDQVAFTLDFTITNLGPDIIKPADSIIFYLGLGTTLYPSTQKVFHVPANLAVSGTASFSVSNLSVQGAGGSLQVCSHVVLLNRVLADTVKDNVLGGNNASCVTLHFSGTGVGKVQLGNLNKIVASPNPATSNITIGFTTNSVESTSIEIFDMQGRLVKTIDNGLSEIGSHSVDIDLTDMAKGVYIYKVNTGNTSTTNKFIIE